MIHMWNKSAFEIWIDNIKFNSFSNTFFFLGEYFYSCP